MRTFRNRHLFALGLVALAAGPILGNVPGAGAQSGGATLNVRVTNARASAAAGSAADYVITINGYLVPVS